VITTGTNVTTNIGYPSIITNNGTYNAVSRIPYIGSYIAPSILKPSAKDYPQLEIPVGPVDSTLPRMPTWFEIIKNALRVAIDTVVVGFKILLI
jgi:hypothetical protein